MSNLLFSKQNTSFAKQQNPLQSLELPCDREYNQVNLGACAYFLLLDYPVDVKVYISLNPERKDAFLVDNRNTGFRITDVYTSKGVPAQVQNVYLWTEGITNLQDSKGGAAKVRIASSGVYSFEILNNSSINAISQVGNIGKIGQVESINKTIKATTQNMTDSVIFRKLTVWGTTPQDAHTKAQAVIPPTLFQRGKNYTIRAILRGLWGQFLSGDFYQFTAYSHRGGYSLGTAYGANYNNLATFKDSNETLEFSGDFILDNLISRDTEGNTGLIIWFMARGNVRVSTDWLAQADFIIYES
ncbi:hypothetical protein [uncultured Helicobacter sp.]|uniref:hypothetical protein n=1 Tax=uncultured Helicobacter sp. TaxID=175537 RepID=UPI002614EB26|nr:hypothetical protein [uncultured Helicobacter sp.]